MSDFWNECFDSNLNVPPQEFERTFCRVCMNPECLRSAAHGTTWIRRMASQVDRLIENPLFADPGDPRFRTVREMDFPSAVREAMRLEISDRRGDWSIPDEVDAVNLASEMAVKAVSATPSPPPDVIDDEDDDEVIGKVLRRHDVRGTSGVYVVTLEEKIIGRPEWLCTCKAFEFGRARPCKHILFAQTLPPPEPEVPKVENTARPMKATGNPTPPPPKFQAPPPTQPAAPAAPQRPFYPPLGNIPMPSGGVMVDGTAPPAPKDRPGARPTPGTTTTADDPWAPPPPKPKVVPVGGRVVLGGAKDDGGKR